MVGICLSYVSSANEKYNGMTIFDLKKINSKISF